MPRKVTPTYVLLNQVTLAAASSNIDFSNIPQSFSDLVFVINATPNSNVATIGLRFNNDSGNNYSYVSVVGNGSSASTSMNTQSVALIGYTNSTGTWMNIAQVLDYSAMDKHKTILGRDNNPASELAANANRWASTSAITRVAVNAAVNTFAAGTTISMYGIVA